MRCISVYTKDFAQFSDVYEQILQTPLLDHEEKSIEGILFSDSGEISEDYVKRLKAKPDVVVMKLKDTGVMILQHGQVFEMFIPESQNVVH